MKCPIANVVVAEHMRLNVSRECLSRSPSWLEFETSFESRIATATGFVSSREPYAKARLVLNLKDGPVASDWSAQLQRMASIGLVSAYADGSGRRKHDLSSCAITRIETGYDGGPATRIIIDGTISEETAAGVTL